MGHREKLIKLIELKNGLVLTKEAELIGIPRKYLSIFASEGLVERVGHGIYVSPEAFKDDMYILQIKASKAIFSHDTALYLHDLSDRDPLVYSVTIPAGYNGSKLRESNMSVYSIKKELYELGLIELKTQFGRTIKVYDKERTICDIVRNRNNMDVAILNEAIKRYLSNKDKNIPVLLKYAKKLNVQNIIRGYMEILQ